LCKLWPIKYLTCKPFIHYYEVDLPVELRRHLADDEFFFTETPVRPGER
jgi:hypothetical protein